MVPRTLYRIATELYLESSPILRNSFRKEGVETIIGTVEKTEDSI